jgi:hypothetical protein
MKSAERHNNLCLGNNREVGGWPREARKLSSLSQRYALCSFDIMMIPNPNVGLFFLKS